MASWGDSFSAAMKIVMYSIIWWIVGGIVLVFGFAAIAKDQLLLGALSGLIGYVIIAFGAFASILKVSAEFLKNELR